MTYASRSVFTIQPIDDRPGKTRRVEGVAELVDLHRDSARVTFVTDLLVYVFSCQSFVGEVVEWKLAEGSQSIEGRGFVRGVETDFFGSPVRWRTIIDIDTSWTHTFAPYPPAARTEVASSAAVPKPVPPRRRNLIRNQAKASE